MNKNNFFLNVFSILMRRVLFLISLICLGLLICKKIHQCMYICETEMELKNNLFEREFNLKIKDF